MRYRIFTLLMVVEALALALLVAAGHFDKDRTAPARRCNRQLVRAFELTDLAIWTGARYTRHVSQADTFATRHVSQADTFAAFQDSMGALEHFPEGALAPLPPLERPFKPEAAAGPLTDAAAYGKGEHEPTS
jgi:hypothetical protein